MEWIVYAFMGGLGLIVALIIGVAVYQMKWGKAKGEPNQGVKLRGTKHDPVQPNNHMNNF